MTIQRPTLAGILLACVLSACSAPPPKLSSVDPATGPSGGGTELTLAGEGFQVGIQVEIGGVLAEVLTLDPAGTQVTVRTSGGMPGEQQVVARIQDDGAISEPLTFSYEPLQVVETQPGEGETVPAKSELAVTFDQEIQDGASIEIEGIAGESTWHAETQTLSFTAEKSFTAASTHTAHLRGVQDQAGNALEHSFTFQIEARPVTRSVSSGRRGGRKFDDERLETGWFGGDDLQFVEADNIDYLWVRDGFSIKGRTFQVRRWEGPYFLGPVGAKRDTEDRQLARQMTPQIHRALADALRSNWSGKAKVSTSGGDVIVYGRIVDCSAGNLAAKVIVGFGAGAGRTTFDMRFVDASSGRLLVAVHSRVVSGTHWSTTDSKFVKWMDKFAKSVNKKSFATLYRKGSRKKK